MKTMDERNIDQLLTIDQVAEVCCVSTQTITRWVNQNNIVPPIRLGRRMIRWRPEEFRQWLADCKRRNEER